MCFQNFRNYLVPRNEVLNMAYCKHLKIKLNHTFECKKIRKKITLKDCANCLFKEYKCTTYSQNCAKKEYKSNGNQIRNSTDNKSFKQHKTVKMKMKSNKMAKLERNRFSLFSADATHCYFCSSTHKLTWHEIFRGKNRANSMKYGLCLRMCLSCHEWFQDNKDFNEYWHKKGQALFEQTYPDLDFIEIFKRNYK